MLLIAAVVQGAARASLIFIGHMTYEPSVDVEGQPASKGLCRDLEQREAEERAKVIARLSAGQTPFAEEAAVAAWTGAPRAA